MVVVTSNISDDDAPFVEIKNIEGIKVVYIKNRFFSSMGKIRRIFAYIRFSILSTYYALKEPGVDLVYASSTPLTIAVPALLCKYVKKQRFVFELRDLWPDVPYELGFIKNNVLFNFLKKFEHRCYKSADAIISISEGIKDLVGLEYSFKTSVYPFGSNTSMFSIDKNFTWRVENGIVEEYLFVYTGSIGNANGMDYLLSAAKHLKDMEVSNIHIALIGQGSFSEQAKEIVKSNKLGNVSFHPPVPVNSLVDIYASADAGIITWSNVSETHRHTASPNKFFDYIAAGLPVFFHVSGPFKTFIEAKNVGVYADEDDSREMAIAFKNFTLDKARASRMSMNARQLAETELGRDKILTDLVEKLEHIMLEK